MDSLERSSHSQLLSHFTGRIAADALMQRFGGLTDLAPASCEDLQCVKGVGKSRATSQWRPQPQRGRYSGDPRPDPSRPTP